jgi:Fis family transcriptional regulator, factor for inversion stimulation protein
MAGFARRWAAPEITRMLMAQQPQPAVPAIERRKQPLCNAVRIAMSLYFDQLNGHRPDSLYKLVIEEVERPLLEILMDRCRGNQTKAAQCLGLNRGTLRKKLKHYGLD